MPDSTPEARCPHCGYCPHCGRVNLAPIPLPWFNPWYGQPYPYYGPTWINVGTTAGVGVGSIISNTNLPAATSSGFTVGS